MSPEVIGLLGLLVLFILLAMRMQIGFAMALVGFVGFIILNNFQAAMGVLGLEPFKITADYTLSVIPLFLLMGEFANESRMGAELYDMLYKWIGFLPGGLAMATVGACAFFAAITGSSLATAAMFGMIAYPEMRNLNYAETLATGCIAAGGTLGILIPPSSVLIIYGILTEQSIARLFIAGMLPGILLALIFMGTIFVITKRRPELGAPGPRFTIKEKVTSLKATWGIILLFILVIGGLYTGWFTPTEAAGVGAFGAFVLALLKRSMGWKTLVASLKGTVRSTAFIFGILIGAMVFQYFMTLSQIPEKLASWIVMIGVGRYVVVSAIILAFMVMGCFMEGLSIMFLAVPIVYPIVIRLGFDPIWFGVIITLTMEMSLITPPVGVNVFVLHGVVKDVPMYTIFRGILPFWIAMIICIIILIVFPQIALFLPNTMMG
ncbi:MAG: TRAP transporter large permease [Deltaproteobacteria bacterium]|nr:TRAP transporter large permease [Deltaproteobacteria bacterium]